MARKPNPKTCEKCPYRYEAKGCPCWIEPEAGFMEKNIQTGEERLVTGCFYQVIPKLMAHMVAAVGQPRAALESWREEMIKGFDLLAKVRRFPPALPRSPQALTVDYTEVGDGEQISE